MGEPTDDLYLELDAQRKKRQSVEADRQDKADLEAIAMKIKRRSKNDRHKPITTG